MPGLLVLLDYKPAWALNDLVAGLVLTTMLVPVGIAYAGASGVPGIYGLYATIVPLLVYAVFGPSRIMMLGPDSSLAALRDETGRRPVYGGTTKFQDDPAWRDLVLFYEYFHGDNGAGLGASHQTGWTGVIAPLLDIFARVSQASLLEQSADEIRADLVRAQVGGD